MNNTIADVYFNSLMSVITKLLDAEEEQGRTVSIEIRNRDVLWVWRGQPGFVGYSQVNCDPRQIWRFDRELHHPVPWESQR
jgi:hypothetical protein